MIKRDKYSEVLAVLAAEARRGTGRRPRPRPVAPARPARARIVRPPALPARA